MLPQHRQAAPISMSGEIIYSNSTLSAVHKDHWTITPTSLICQLKNMLPNIDSALETGLRACQHLRMRRESQRSRRRYRFTQLIGAVNSLRYKRYTSKQVEPEVRRLRRWLLTVPVRSRRERNRGLHNYKLDTGAGEHRRPSLRKSGRCGRAEQSEQLG